MIKAKNTLEGKLNVSVVKEYPELENVTITPTLEEQKLKSEKYGFEEVIVEAIPATNIEINPSIEEQVKTGIFKTVTVNAIKGQELNLNPSEEQQNYEGVFLGVNINPIQVEEIETNLDFSSGDAIELKAQEGAYIKKATINKDANLTPENIKSGVSIAGISGEVADTSDADATSDDIISGKTAYVGNEKIAGTYIPLDTSDATATAEDIAKDKTAYVNGEKITGTKEISEGGDSEILDNYIASIESNSLKIITKIPEGTTKIGDYAFYYCTNAKMETLPESVTKIGKWAFGYCKWGDFKTLTLEGDITAIGESAFFYSGYEKIIMKNVTSVPSTDSYKNVFQYTQNKYSTIYVPDNLVADFKRVEPYYSIQTNIKGLSQLGS